MSLKDKTISGMFWSFGQNFGAKGLQILTSIILARLLAPEAFGLIGMLAVFIAVSQGLINGGFSKALIQKKDTDKEDYSSVFYINLGISILLYILLYFGAPLIADFYAQPQLIPLTRVLTLVFVINAFSYVQSARLKKEMRFKTLMIIHLPSTLLSAAVAIAMAYTGFGVWSLVTQQLVMRFAYAVQIWIYAQWKPLLSFNREKAKGLFSFGSRLMMSSILDKIFSNIYLIVIGKFFPIDALGYYKIANNLTRTPTNSLSSAVKAVTFPAFSTIQDDNKRLKRGYKKTIQQVFFWVCPLMVIAGVLATPLFRFVLTAKWLPAVTYFRILCVYGVISSVNSFNLEVVTVKGKANLFFKLKIVKKTVIAVGIGIAIFFGVFALLWVQVFSMIIAYWLNSHFSGKYISYPVSEQLKEIFPIFTLSFGMGLAVFGLDFIISNMHDWIRLIVGGAWGMIFYWIIAWWANLDPYLDFKKIVRKKVYN